MSLRFLISIFLLILSSETIAQPSSGSLLQEIESQPSIREPLPEVLPNLVPGAPPVDNSKAKKYFIKKFEFVGNLQIPVSDLNAVLKNYINNNLSFTQLQAAAAVVSELYRDRGWLVRAFLPSQDITNGTVTVQIIEARLGGVKIDNQSKHISTETIRSWLDKNIPLNTLLSLNHLDRALLLINDLPGVTIVGDLQRGNNPGETILAVKVTDKPIIYGQVGVDNYGDPSTGNVRTTASVSVNGALGFNEQLTVYGLYTDGTDYGRVSLTAPVGRDGLRMGINGSFMNYRVINPAFTDLHANGEARTAGFESSYPIIRSRQQNLFVLGNYNHNDFYNTNINGTSSQYNTNTFQLGLSGNRIDGFGIGAVSTGSLMMTFGQVNLNASPSQLADGIGPQTEGGFTKLRYSFNRQQTVFRDFSVYGSISGQGANKNLDVSEQLYMGGPYSVRAYTMGQGASTQGNLTTLELRMNLNAGFQLAGFYDYANVQTYKTTGFASAPENNFYPLQGVGLNLSWNGPLNSQIKAIWARRTGTLPDSVQAYLEQNGGTSANRYWLTGSLPF
jgi:hemolysin activation/secretion protein